jgi:hypothetical protein
MASVSGLALSEEAGGVVAVLYPGLDLPGLCESEWELTRDSRGRRTAVMANRLEKWVGFAAWSAWFGRTCLRY